jgi:hypothetical protein
MVSVHRALQLKFIAKLVEKGQSCLFFQKHQGRTANEYNYVRCLCTYISSLNEQLHSGKRGGSKLSD